MSKISMIKRNSMEQSVIDSMVLGSKEESKIMDKSKEQKERIGYIEGDQSQVSSLDEQSFSLSQSQSLIISNFEKSMRNINHSFSNFRLNEKSIDEKQSQLISTTIEEL